MCSRAPRQLSRAFDRIWVTMQHAVPHWNSVSWDGRCITLTCRRWLVIGSVGSTASSARPARARALPLRRACSVRTSLVAIGNGARECLTECKPPRRARVRRVSRVRQRLTRRPLSLSTYWGVLRYRGRRAQRSGYKARVAKYADCSAPGSEPTCSPDVEAPSGLPLPVSGRGERRRKRQE